MIFEFQWNPPVAPNDGHELIGIHLTVERVNEKKEQRGRGEKPSYLDIACTSLTKKFFTFSHEMSVNIPGIGSFSASSK